MNPDLVIAGEYSSGPTVAMLRRLGIRVEVLPPTDNIAAIRDQITRMGELLEQPENATDLLDDFDRDLQTATSGKDRGRAALYYANGFTAGGDTLAGTILRTAGYRNIADEYGITGNAPMPLELLVMAQPDYLIVGSKWPGQSRSEAILDHPALARTATVIDEATDANWVCGTPFILDAVEALQ